LEILKASYGGLICKGFTTQEFEASIGESASDTFSNFLAPIMHDAEKLQLNAVSEDVLKGRLVKIGLEHQAKALWNLQVSKSMTLDEIIQAAQPHFPRMGELARLWEETPLGQISLTSIGAAIGYANLQRATDFSSDFSIWIK
jgi:hypothetical protein